ncbi:DNA sulfur modification protein DndD [Flavobacterium granuli]|uniref:DNA sulfur modification protein DndD n=1 Tax=Flavobacterium granuli TaxID=280093 RepID=A0A1M5SBK3_9FLAO|nr:DNA sulfur modification protein DndD [Flavobacterium granuli]PRZ21261.1 DNA sulfur modification protein DndD [Flavobacterium granuli]SHH35293.1 DNA sulfur modification protein DndD [Flavobacterium granuli]
MKFSNIEINNFRQYYNSVNIDLTTSSDKNIIIIGGKNGYGKTNFLLAIVWCLYGDKISQIDENFKKEIQKEKNYSSFMQQSINWTAKRENKTNFSVNIFITEIELPELRTLSSSTESVIIERTFDVGTMNETLSIIDAVSKIEIFDEESDKINFINDYIIPIDAAKFVFFDAEKIGEIANLSIKEEGSFINDALGKILGLDTYETLIDDVEFYINNLKKEGATKNLQEIIANKENEIRISEIDIEKFEEENAERLKEIDDLKKKIREYDNLISKHSKQGNSIFDREAVLIEIEKLKIKEDELNERFNELSEIIPLAILTGKLEEVNEHLEIQEKNETSQIFSKENSEKIESFIELLFNKPPEPENSTMSLKDKMFYYQKAQSLGSELFKENDDYVELEFEHDLNNSEKRLISDAINLINTQSKDLFETTIDEFNETKIKLSDLTKTLSKVDADLEDELILDYSSKKETADYNVTEKNRKIGENHQQITKLKNDIVRLNQQLVTLVKKVDINEQNKLKIKKSNEYIEVLNLFLDEQKEKHKDSLEKTILIELKTLMHKLNSEENQSKFIEDVKVLILASGQGMKITLIDQDDNEIRKESLSSGEKQIYISCLIKAILKESIQSLPIFIDTPLGRLDEEHRDSITKKYYPALSEQVVLFSTNSEITPKRFKDISANVSKSYLLVNDGANTNLVNGYFQSYEN